MILINLFKYWVKNATINMSSLIENCIICLEPVSNKNDIKKKIHPNCTCLATIDQHCLEQCVLSGLLCPICRLKSHMIHINNPTVQTNNAEEPLDLRIINRIIRRIFRLNPLPAFIVFMSFSITVTIVYLIPKFILIFLKYNIIRFVNRLSERNRDVLRKILYICMMYLVVYRWGFSSTIFGIILGQITGNMVLH